MVSVFRLALISKSVLNIFIEKDLHIAGPAQFKLCGVQRSAVNLYFLELGKAFKI